jgi:hypothetical protein
MNTMKKTRAKTRRIELAWIDHPAELRRHLLASGWSPREAINALGVLSCYRIDVDPNDDVSHVTMAKLRNALRNVAPPSSPNPRIGRSSSPQSTETGRARLSLVGAVGAAASVVALLPGALGITSTLALIVMSTDDETSPSSPDSPLFNRSRSTWSELVAA